MLLIEESQKHEIGAKVPVSEALRTKITEEGDRIKRLAGHQFPESELDAILQNAINIGLSPDL